MLALSATGDSATGEVVVVLLVAGDMVVGLSDDVAPEVGSVV